MEKYKDCSPEVTIARIKYILSQNNIKVIIKKSSNGYFHSCRIDICNKRLKELKIGTNGKGMNEKYAIASGLAELMERMQNGLLFGYYNNGSTCFREHLKNFINCDNQDTCDFYSVMEHNIIKMSLEEILLKNGSSGMCAGNSAKEAITQGICEIFERYAIKEIYEKKLSLPTIPLDFFKGSKLYKKICNLLKQNPNLKIIIKDCSLNCGLPVVGVIIIDTKNQLYNFRLGSDCNPIVAAERCFTELFQNSRNFIGNYYKFSDIPTKYDLLKTIHDASGIWPVSIFKKETQFSFNPTSIFYSKKIENDLKYCVNIIKKLGGNLYVRDNSFLGFPSYYVVVPEMSVLKKVSTQNDLIDFIKFSQINVLSELELHKLATNMDNNYLAISNEEYFISIKNYFPYNSNIDIQNLELDFFIALLMYRTKKYDRFVFYMHKYLKDKDRKEYVYFYAAYNFVVLYQIQKQNLESVIYILSKCYGEELTKEVIKDLINPNKIFRYYKFPSFPNCSKCKLKKDCRVDDVVKICVNLHEKELVANIDQSNLDDVFNFDLK